MSEDTHGPFMETTTRQTLRGGDEIDVYPVVGTEGVWAVYPSPERPGRWVGLHIPTGMAAHVNFASREEAEDVISWTWLNAIDREGARSSNQNTVCAAFGARVRSRFLHGKPLREPRRRGVQKIGRHKSHQTDAEAFYTELVRKHTAEREKWLKTMYNERAKLVEDKRKTQMTINTVTNMTEAANKEAERQRDRWAAIEDSRIKAEKEIADRKRELDQQYTDLMQQSMELNALRTAMVHSIAAIDIGSVLTGEGSVDRHLRKIRIKNVYNPELDQGEPDGSS